MAAMGKDIIFTTNSPAPIGPYSQAVRAGNTLYVSGQIPVNVATGQIEKENITAETNLVMKNIEAILRQAGLAFDYVVKCSIFVTDMKDFKAVNDVYGSYFTHEPPARETVQVAALPKGVHVEISCIAVIQ